jgi:hypothetical protein
MVVEESPPSLGRGFPVLWVTLAMLNLRLTDLKTADDVLGSERQVFAESRRREPVRDNL